MYSSGMMRIRDAGPGDIEAITALANALLPTTTYEWTETLHTTDDRRAWLAAKAQAGMPLLVADDDGDVVGWAGYDDFRDTARWPGYRFTVEHSVHVRADRRGAGVGSALMQPLIARASALGKHVMVAGVDASNAASIRFHERLGFERVAHFKEVGFKFGRWLDLVFLQRFL
jgi:phosphinothricin acetyltransferase